MEDKQERTSWHSAFCGAMELEFLQYKGLLDFNSEFQLSKEPLRVDLLVIKKIKDIVIDIDIGRLFRTHNIIEYKSPNDGLTIDDLSKTAGYAYLYKGLGATVDAVPLSEISITMVRDTKPVELFRKIEAEGGCIEEKYPGIYYITGIINIPTQFILTSSLTKEMHACLRVLSNKAQKDDIQRFIELVSNFTEPIDKHNADALIQVSINANKEVYDKIRKENLFMCQALRELFKDEIEEEIRTAVQEAEKKAAEAEKKAVAEAEKKAAEAKKKAVAEAEKKVAEAEKKASEAEKKAFDSRIADIKNLMKKLGMDAKTIMEGMGISAADQIRYMAML